VSDITDAGGTALTPTGGGAGGGGLISKFIALGGAAQSAAKGITSLSDAEKILADAQKQLTKDTEALHVTTNAYAQSASDVNTSMVKTTEQAAAWGASMANQSKITG